MNPKFNVELLQEANEFLNGLNEKARDKIIYNIRKSQVVNDNELFKKLNENVLEFRTLHNKTKYRLFAFWDKTDKTETVVISTHGIERRPKRHRKKRLKRRNKL